MSTNFLSTLYIACRHNSKMLDKLVLKYIVLETGVHPLQNALFIVRLVLGVHVQYIREVN